MRRYLTFGAVLFLALCFRAFGDYNATQGVGWGVELKNWELKGPGQFPFIDARDGQKILREDAADAFEGRIIGYYQQVCKKVAGTVRGRLT